MAREKKPPEEEGVPMWLVTFSDLVTLLLTFFVLLLSMASMDQVLLSRINPYSSSFSIMGSMSPGRIPHGIAGIAARCHAETRKAEGSAVARRHVAARGGYRYTG
jgi:flagellar motor protein MotB